MDVPVNDANVPVESSFNFEAHIGYEIEGFKIDQEACIGGERAVDWAGTEICVEVSTTHTSFGANGKEGPSYHAQVAADRPIYPYSWWWNSVIIRRLRILVSMLGCDQS